MKRISFGVALKRRTAALVLAAVALFGFASAVRANVRDDYDRVKQSILHNAGLQKDFPRLHDNFEVLGDPTSRFNCIAWSLGITDHWVNPATGPSDDPLSPMDRLYAEKGYHREQDLDWRPEPGEEKVVLYATLNLDGTINQVTHAAREEADGTFTSKLGADPLIHHAAPEDLRGPAYGLPVAVYVRPVGGIGQRVTQKY